MTTTSKSYEHLSYREVGAFVKDAYNKGGASILNDDSFVLTSYSATTAVLTYANGIIETVRGNIDFSSDASLFASTISRLDDSYGGNLVWSWEGLMTVRQFLVGDWPDTTKFGNSLDNLMEAYWIDPVDAGAGDDYIVLGQGGKAAGGTGNDFFIALAEHNTLTTILDYQAGDKIVLPGFDSFDTLARSVIGISQQGPDFTVSFQNQQDGFWSLTFANLTPAQLHLDDVLTGSAAEAALQPIFDAFGGRAIADAYFM